MDDTSNGNLMRKVNYCRSQDSRTIHST